MAPRVRAVSTMLGSTHGRHPIGMTLVVVLATMLVMMLVLMLVVMLVMMLV